MIEDPPYLTNIEKALYRMARANFLEMGEAEFCELFFTYYAQKLTFFNHIYAHIQNVIQNYTDHSQKHITRILKIYDKILKNHVIYIDPYRNYEINMPRKEEAFNFYEVYLLLSATVLHDMGNIEDRYAHEKNIIKVLNKLPTFFNNESLKDYALKIAESHRGPEPIIKNIPFEPDYRGEELKLRYIAALLQFADELDEGEVRVDQTYYDVKKHEMTDKTLLHWDISFCIKKVDPLPDSRKIVITSIINNRDNCFKIYNIDLEGEIKQIAFIDELIRRINKINETRKYYMRFITKDIMFHGIEFHLKIGNDPPFITQFDDVYGYKDFFSIYPQVNPANNISNYELKGVIKNE